MSSSANTRRRENLQRVASNGQPAHRHRAQELLAALASDDPDVAVAADALWDAYLNDPYLTRTSGNPPPATP